MQVPEVPLACMALRRVHMSRSRLALNTAVYFFRAGALSEERVHQQRIIRVGPNHFTSLFVLVATLFQTKSKRCLVFLSLQNRTIGALTVSLTGKHKQTVYYAKAFL